MLPIYYGDWLVLKKVRFVVFCFTGVTV